MPRGTLPPLLPTPDRIKQAYQVRTISNHVYQMPADSQVEWKTWSAPEEDWDGQEM